MLRLLTARGETLAVAESLTGGLVAAELTAVPGASQAFRGSVTAYATDLKHELLGVDGALLAERGAVDAQVARADGGRRTAGRWAPTGASRPPVSRAPTRRTGSPSGTVYVAVAGPSAGSVAVAEKWRRCG